MWIYIAHTCGTSNALNTLIHSAIAHFLSPDQSSGTTLPYPTLPFGWLQPCWLVSAEALLSYGPMSFPVHRALICIFNHRRIAFGFLWLPSLVCLAQASDSYSHRWTRPDDSIGVRKSYPSTDPSRQLPKPRHDEQPTPLRQSLPDELRDDIEDSMQLQLQIMFAMRTIR